MQIPFCALVQSGQVSALQRSTYIHRTTTVDRVKKTFELFLGIGRSVGMSLTRTLPKSTLKRRVTIKSAKAIDLIEESPFAAIE